MNIFETLDSMDRSLDVLIEESSRLREADIEQAAAWIQRAMLKAQDVDSLLRRKSFLDFSKLEDTRGNAIRNQAELEQALEGVAATDPVREVILSAWADYEKFRYDGSGMIRASTAGYASRNLSLAAANAGIGLSK